jgi:hypothetical protein
VVFFDAETQRRRGTQRKVRKGNFIRIDRIGRMSKIISDGQDKIDG